MKKLKVVDVVGREAVFALCFSLDVVAVGVHRQPVVILEQVAAAARIKDVIGADRVGDDCHHRPLARRRRPRKIALRGMQAVQVAGAAGVEELLVVMQIEAVEIGALAADHLLDAQDLAALHFERLAGPRLDHQLVEHPALRHLQLRRPRGRNAERHFIPSIFARRGLRRRMLPKCAADQLGAGGRLAGLYRIVDQFQLLLIEPQSHHALGHRILLGTWSLSKKDGGFA
jgi:hypothetical protein